MFSEQKGRRVNRRRGEGEKGRRIFSLLPFSRSSFEFSRSAVSLPFLPTA
jgi:hypothetical protein